MRKRNNKINQFKQTEAPNFDAVPVPMMCESIQMLMDNLASRGILIRDFDNKDKVVKRVGMIGGKVYFLAVKEEHNDKTT